MNSKKFNFNSAQKTLGDNKNNEQNKNTVIEQENINQEQIPGYKTTSDDTNKYVTADAKIPKNITKNNQENHFQQESGVIKDTSDFPHQLSENTIRQYHTHVKTMHRSFLRSQPDNPILTTEVLPMDLVEFLLQRAANAELRPHTFMSYRSALLYWLSIQEQTPEIHMARLKLQAEMPRTGFKPAKKGQAPVSLYSSRSVRRRTFPKADYQKLMDELQRRADLFLNNIDKRATDKPIQLALWLQAGFVTGLRPTEWQEATWHDKEKGQLLVQNAKIKKSVSPMLKGKQIKTKSSRMVNVPEEHITAVQAHMDFVKRHLASGEPFSKYYDSNRVYLWRVCGEIFDDKRRITLYMMRGQFAANTKKTIGLEAAAQKMGCAPNTASTFYGGISHSHKGLSAFRKKEIGRRHPEQEQSSASTESTTSTKDQDIS